MPYVREEAYLAEKEKAEHAMNRLLHVRDTQGLQVEQVIVPGPPATPAAPQILEYAIEHGADLVVMGTHGRRGVKRLFMGSVAEEVLREAPCPVLAVHERDSPFPEHPIARILVPLDFSAPSERALAYAKELAGRYQARLVLLHVLYLPTLPSVYGLESDPGLGPMQQLEAALRKALQAAAESMEQAGLGGEPEK